MGLLRGVARTAVVAGTATAVSNRVSRRQANRWAAQDPYAQQDYAPPPPQPAAPPAPAPSATDDMYAQLERLGRLRDDGVLTDAEFSAQKAKLLAG
ncbi:SHOCT domain-containing protein [Promicromonospora sp. NPDC057138]|uniref:SHOCT domain-containing protein n=1 Tax=Promicromonospora sp. NPDC057138 TaxID=3346031 RepID=UPI003629399D